jgi:hypothetical protein
MLTGPVEAMAQYPPRFGNFLFHSSLAESDFAGVESTGDNFARFPGEVQLCGAAAFIGNANAYKAPLGTAKSHRLLPH